MENMEENCEKIWKIWKKPKLNSEKDMENPEENQVELWKDMENTEERQVELW